MTDGQRKIAGVGSLAWIFTSVIGMAIFASQTRDEDPSAVLLAVIFVAALISAVLGIWALVLMFRHVYKYSGFTERRQTFWTAILLIFNMYAAPFYYFRHLRHSAPAEPT
jgi:uncharacterized membrane-anchored protein